ncbi:uncharacterized protein ACA1_031590 [Acanthamoeba castellanii str. Neff]|uniref:Uncharacterized protein n=1 Tax=Acanthamoeba castellanii (strain ATCC 30010 / Neff) TaxID=1257118 RepID=L8GV38_ACACF|nr:uncharacterized protein ACA1_031590 [Acanthamoeba castellanii str. Neff]ELR15961.1 hypothetical protein ACA1_031590 [Acanthamoeba castellanii str. Neff]
MRTGILGDSTSLERLVGVPKQLQVLRHDGHINWVETAAMAAAEGGHHRHGAVFTSTLLDNNRELLRVASGAASTEEGDHLDLDLIVFSFAAADRCSLEDRNFKAAFQWADAYFRARNKPAQVGVLLVDYAVNKPAGPARVDDDRIIGLVAGDPYLEALMRARRIVRWNATTPALDDHDHHDGLPDLSDDLARVLADFCRRPVVSLQAASGSSLRGGSGGARAGGDRFVNGLLVCSLAVLVALLVLHLSPSLQALAAGALLPESAAELTRLRLENGAQEAMTVGLQKDNELLKEINARQKKHNDELTKDVTDLKHRNTRLQAQVDQLTAAQLAATQTLTDRTLVISSLCQGCCQGETAVGGSMCRLCSSAPAA